MGIPITAINTARMSAFFDELTKEAAIIPVEGIGRTLGRWGMGIKEFLSHGIGWRPSQWQEAAGRIFNPLEGWRRLSPRYETAAKALEARAANATREGRAYVHTPIKAENVPLGHILHQKAPLTQRLGDLGTELYHRGWTATEGPVGRFVPLGGKALTTGFAATYVPEILHPKPASPTGEGGRAEAIGGGLLGGLGWAAGTGTGMLPMTALGLGAERLGRKAGRIIDRLRTGATLKGAVTAPTENEAVKQLETIQKYYG